MPQDAASFGINTPDLSDQLNPGRRSVADEQQAAELVKGLIEDSRERSRKNARIMAKYNAEKPHSQDQLQAEGLGWKSNFSTKPLTLLIEKVAPRFRMAVDAVKYLTNSAFPDTVQGASQKTEAFRREITETCRARRGWKSLISSIAQENALFGYTSVAWLDESSWMPQHFRQDEFFVPAGTKQEANTAQVVVLKEDYLLHELFARIEDREAASDAGWKVPKVVEKINDAMPDDRRSQWADWERIHQDLIREGSVSASYHRGAKIVTLWSLLVVEIDGKISQYRLSDRDFKMVFSREDRFDSMEEAVSFYTFQQGNGTMHGSKGIGREIYAMAGILDRARNDVVDRLLLAGKIIVQGDERILNRFRMSLVGNAILIGSQFSVSSSRVDGDVEPFFALDDYLSRILDQIAGASSPKQLEGERVTAAQVNLVASREEESRDVIIERFISQFADMMSTIQIRLVDPGSEDKDAKEMQKRLLEVMTRKELNEIAKRPVAGTVSDYSEQERQAIAFIAAENAGNPLYNQKELQRRKLIAQVDEQFAEAVLLPDEDPTELAEQTRLQQLELMALSAGQQIPTSPRDNHQIHLDVLKGAIEAATQSIASGDPAATASLEAFVTHGNEHLAAALQSGVKKDALKEVIDFLLNATNAITQLAQLEQAQQPIAQAGQELVAAEEELPTL
jgi:hypothetical protein